MHSIPRECYAIKARSPRLPTTKRGTTGAPGCSKSDRLLIPVKTSKLVRPPLLPNAMSVSRRSPIIMVRLRSS
jgi:hypothetical protein